MSGITLQTSPALFLSFHFSAMIMHLFHLSICEANGWYTIAYRSGERRGALSPNFKISLLKPGTCLQPAGWRWGAKYFLFTVMMSFQTELEAATSMITSKCASCVGQWSHANFNKCQSDLQLKIALVPGPPRLLACPPEIRNSGGQPE